VLIIRVAASLYFWLFMVLTSLVLYPIAVCIRCVTYPFDKRLRLLHRFTSVWGSLYTWCVPLWRVHIAGKEHQPADAAHVVVANHQSFADIIVLFRLRMHYKWVSKIENFRAPLIGWNMTLNQYIPITRGTMKGNLQMMRACEETLRAGNSIMMFPEGTRSPDGRMRSFKDGAFELALRTKSPILPIVITGTSQALPKRGILIQKSDIHVKVLPPIPYSEFSGKSAREVNTMVWERMNEAVDSHQSPVSYESNRSPVARGSSN
jgi:1-acyl-sn-glycerol-3-phosphate acyltransferase